jgi:hypothetical protein
MHVNVIKSSDMWKYSGIVSLFAFILLNINKEKRIEF